MGLKENDLDHIHDRDVHQLARELTAVLGPTLTAALAGVDRDTVQEWAAGHGTDALPDVRQRLAFAHLVWAEVSKSDGDSVARSWFTGLNPWLSDRTPITAIREDRHAEVRRAALSFIDGDVDE